MQFDLINNWGKICSIRRSFDWFESKWIYRWGINQVNASLIYNVLLFQKPKVIIETGTFEGHGTFAMAKAIHDSGQGGAIYTIDYDGDPITNVDTIDWEKLREIRNGNLESIRNMYPSVEVNFIDGDSREILPDLIRKSRIKWDFFFQDSMHFYDGIISEWNAIKNAASDKAIAVFDDISLCREPEGQDGSKFCQYFVKSTHLEEWNYINCEIDHHQFWIQKK